MTPTNDNKILVVEAGKEIPAHLLAALKAEHGDDLIIVSTAQEARELMEKRKQQPSRDIKPYESPQPTPITIQAHHDMRDPFPKSGKEARRDRRKKDRKKKKW